MSGASWTMERTIAVCRCSGPRGPVGGAENVFGGAAEHITLSRTTHLGNKKCRCFERRKKNKMQREGTKQLTLHTPSGCCRIWMAFSPEIIDVDGGLCANCNCSK